MHLKVILNRMEKYSSFVFSGEIIEGNEVGPDKIIIGVKPRLNGKTVCSGCGEVAKLYDNLETRRFEYVPLWTLRVFFEYTMRRVDCIMCGVTVEMLPWATGIDRNDKIVTLIGLKLVIFSASRILKACPTNTQLKS